MTPMLVKSFISPDQAEVLAQTMEQNEYKGELFDGQCDGCRSFYGLYEEELYDWKEKMQDLTGLTLGPTYCYSRIYEEGAVLEPHTDRPACQISATICLRNESDPWPFYALGYDPFIMEPGDAVIYNGYKTNHWREENKSGGRVYNAFIHYVDLNGPYAKITDEIKHRQDYKTVT